MFTFNFNGIQLGGKSKYQVQAPITGLDMPPIRMGQGNWSGRDGGYVSTQFYGPRVVVIKGFYVANTCEEGDALRKSLIEAMPIRQSLPLHITTHSNKNFQIHTYVQDVKMDIQEGGVFGEYQISLVAPDPLIYEAGLLDDPNSGWQELPVDKIVGGGYITAYNMPVQWTPGTTPAVAVNAGDVVINPQIKIVGKVTNPIITNLTTGQFVRVNITTTQNTDELIIDMDRRTITLNGGSVLSFRTLDSLWWGLNPGNNIISYTSSSANDTMAVLVRWRNGYKGI